MDAALIRAHADLPALMPFVHLPVQSGADAVLAAMNRGYTADDYLRLAERLRRARPDLALSSDFIVGFPGETETDFSATLRLVREVGFAQSFSFKYSARPGTPAAQMRRQVADSVKDARLQVLQAELEAQAAAFSEALVGTRTRVLLERPGRHPGQLVGRTPWLQLVHVDGAGHEIGDVVAVDIVARHPHSLAGRVVDNLRMGDGVSIRTADGRDGASPLLGRDAADGLDAVTGSPA
jgi:tRNA-2-methylthio-N6-dimethylallyladenosine synthase